MLGVCALHTSSSRHLLLAMMSSRRGMAASSQPSDLYPISERAKRVHADLVKFMDEKIYPAEQVCPSACLKREFYALPDDIALFHESEKNADWLSPNQCQTVGKVPAVLKTFGFISLRKNPTLRGVVLWLALLTKVICFRPFSVFIFSTGVRRTIAGAN